MSAKTRTPVVLLVEDSPSDAYLTKDALEASETSLIVYLVRDGEEALDFVFRRGQHQGAPRPDIVLMDINLPRKSGFEVLAAMKADPNMEIIPVIMLTTSSNQDDIVRSYRLHASSYMTKPIDIDRFTDAITSFDNFWFSVVDLPIVDD